MSLGVTPDLIQQNTRQKDLPKVTLESSFDVTLEVEDFAVVHLGARHPDYLRSRGIE